MKQFGDNNHYELLLLLNIFMHYGNTNFFQSVVYLWIVFISLFSANISPSIDKANRILYNTLPSMQSDCKSSRLTFCIASEHNKARYIAPRARVDPAKSVRSWENYLQSRNDFQCFKQWTIQILVRFYRRVSSFSRPLIDSVSRFL